MPPDLPSTMRVGPLICPSRPVQSNIVVAWNWALRDPSAETLPGHATGYYVLRCIVWAAHIALVFAVTAIAKIRRCGKEDRYGSAWRAGLS